MTDQSLSLDTILKVAEIVAILGGGWAIAYRGGKIITRVEESLKTQNQILEQQSAEIVDLKEETKKIAGCLTSIAVQDNRINRLEEDVREMKHGKGFVRNGVPG